MFKKRKRYIQLFEKSLKAQRAQAEAAKKGKTPRSTTTSDQAGGGGGAAAAVPEPLTPAEQVMILSQEHACLLQLYTCSKQTTSS